MLIFPDVRREKSQTVAMKSVYMANSPENESLNYHSIMDFTITLDFSNFQVHKNNCESVKNVAFLSV